VCLDLGVTANLVVTGAMLAGNRDLEQSEEGDQQAHHVLRLAEVGHGGECVVKILKGAKGTSRTKVAPTQIEMMKDANERNDLERGQRSVRKGPVEETSTSTAKRNQRFGIAGRGAGSRLVIY
jgi:hypothetical protein